MCVYIYIYMCTYIYIYIYTHTRNTKIRGAAAPPPELPPGPPHLRGTMIYSDQCNSAIYT